MALKREMNAVRPMAKRAASADARAVAYLIKAAQASTSAYGPAAGADPSFNWRASNPPSAAPHGMRGSGRYGLYAAILATLLSVGGAMALSGGKRKDEAPALPAVAPGGGFGKYVNPGTLGALAALGGGTLLATGSEDKKNNVLRKLLGAGLLAGGLYSSYNHYKNNPGAWPAGGFGGSLGAPAQ